MHSFCSGYSNNLDFFRTSTFSEQCLQTQFAVTTFISIIQSSGMARILVITKYDE